MKYIKVVILILSMIMFSNAGAGEIVKVPKGDLFYSSQVSTLCIYGYLFAVVTSAQGSVSITQIFKDGKYWDAPLDPIKCK